MTEKEQYEHLVEISSNARMILSQADNRVIMERVELVKEEVKNLAVVLMTDGKNVDGNERGRICNQFDEDSIERYIEILNSNR